MLDLLIGRRELGKTTLAVKISRDYTTRVIFDPRHIIETSSDLLSDTEIADNLYDMLNVRSEIIIRPKFDIERAFETTCEILYSWLADNPGEPLCFLVDEARFVKEPEKNKHFDFLVRCLPSSQVAILLTCHGIVDVSPDLRRIADFLIFFRLTMEADIIRVRERCGDVVADEVQKLNPYEYIVWNDQRGTWRKETERRKWFVNLKPRAVNV